MYRLGLPGAENADLSPIVELMGRCEPLARFVNSSTKTHKLLVQAGKQQSETVTTLKQEVATHWNSSYAMLESILKNQNILQYVFLEDSFEENRQSLLPTVSEFGSICLLCSLLTGPSQEWWGTTPTGPPSRIGERPPSPRSGNQEWREYGKNSKTKNTHHMPEPGGAAFR